MEKVITCLVLTFLGLSQFVKSEDTFCGTKSPDQDKTCISVRLPWQIQPIYFCTEKSNIKYRNQFGGHQMHCPNQWSNDVLLIATPWDSCPLSSVPDHCKQIQCPPAPFNRTDCVAVPPTENVFDCCPKYVCGPKTKSGSVNTDCRFLQLEPDCMTPPKNKTNCVGFVDSHGCCIKYSCDEDAKPGLCPMQLAARKYSGNAPNSMSMGIKKPGSSMSMESGIMNKRRRRETDVEFEVPKSSASYSFNNAAVSQVIDGMGKPASVSIAVEPYPQGGFSNYPPSSMLSCVGDFNCPTTLKCCSSDMSVYSDGSSIARNTHPTHGTCVEPVMS